MNLKSAVGIIIIGGSPLTLSLLSLLGPNLYVELVWSRLVSEAAYILIFYGPFCALSIVGLVLYMAGRGEFWKSAPKHRIKIISVLLVALGLFLTIEGFWGSLFSYSIIIYYTHKGPGSLFNQLLVEYSPMLLFFMLWFISGIALLADGFKALRSKDVRNPNTPKTY